MSNQPTLKQFKVTFIGRKLGAIGSYSEITLICKAISEEAAVKGLYKHFDFYMYPTDVEEIEG
jgi:hypothetical protein